jgi:UDP-N-acetylmuramoyl-tripeptide--D-alanyl-D-alanine ligase
MDGSDDHRSLMLLVGDVLPLRLEEIAAMVGGRLCDVPDPTAVASGPVVIDSREAVPGGLFAALPGERVDGHDFAAAAVEAGAAAVLAERPVGVPAVVVDDVVRAMGALARAVVRRLDAVTVVGLTGSSGKTSTKDLLGQVLAEHGPTIATERSFNNEIGLPVTVLRAGSDTRYLVLEMGARHRGNITYLTGLTRPNVGLVLNVGTAHVGEFGSREQIALAKAELVEALPADGLAVLNADDELVAAMRARTEARVITFGLAPGSPGSAGPAASSGGSPESPESRGTASADVQAGEVHLDEVGRARFRLFTPGGTAAVRLQVVGRHQVANAVAAAAVAYGLGMDVADIAAALGRARSLSRGRMELTRRTDGITVINDAFNANPDSMKAALTTLAELDGDRTIAVLGEMAELGESAPAEHEDLGRLAGRLGVDRLIAVGTDHAPLIERGAREHPAMETVLVPDRQAAEQLLARELRAGDVVLVKASHAAELEPLAERLAAGGGAAQDAPSAPPQASAPAAGTASGTATGTGASEPAETVESP